MILAYEHGTREVICRYDDNGAGCECECRCAFGKPACENSCAVDGIDRSFDSVSLSHVNIKTAAVAVCVPLMTLGFGLAEARALARETYVVDVETSAIGLADAHTCFAFYTGMNAILGVAVGCHSHVTGKPP